MGPLGAVECNPVFVFDDPLRLETVVDLFEMNRFLFEAAPQSFNKCAVQVLTAPPIGRRTPASVSVAIHADPVNWLHWSGFLV